MNEQNSTTLAQKGAWISIAAYMVLSAVKLIAGYYGQSQGLWADGLNNTTDIIASVAVLIGLKISNKPPDHNHRYGHTRAQTISSLVAAFIMMSVGLQVIYQSFMSYFNNETEKPELLTAVVALIAAAFMFMIYRYNLTLSRKTKNASLLAVAQDNRSDALVSIGAFVGIVGTYIGIDWLDIAAAFSVGFIICKTAWEIFSEASHTLTDGFDEQLLQDIKKTIDNTDGVQMTTDVKARMHGNDILLEATILVDKDLNVVESHDITDHVEERLSTIHQIQHAILHIEPFDMGKKD
ncbi:cation diffusion facilitator family transporter [Peribacillus acanthi]|uniref:cation diffusion facilitator family transporter n=1 Tax=Peribacillus acanthi TaxID=2171554 RepID=UPI000D3EA2A5|nr:cation diffusion facilitator family transporter [Peribacillus acanthi]